ncbi:MAG: DUF1611 domain-containing protein [Pirellulales bacterium]|nr:DUF1611 domain-containing protein [Pirellulales bacterium]
MAASRKIVILTDGHYSAHAAKTAICVVRYRPEEVVAVLDRTLAGKTCGEVMKVGGEIPFVGSLAEAPEADTLLIGIAPPGGAIPDAWRPIVLEAIARKLTVVSGLHDFLCDDPEFSRAAAEHDVRLVDLRDNRERDVASGRPYDERCLRLHTVANDCSCGKMVTTVEVAEGLARAGVDAAFVATGQTGIMIAGDGCPIDRVIADFVSGAAEKLVLANQHHEVMVVEGQGSLYHPRYSGVTFGLLHGLKPDGLIYCYEMGRSAIDDLKHVVLPPHRHAIEFYERCAAVMHPCRVIGVAVNGQHFSDDEVAAEVDRVGRELGLPACDVIRQGPARLVEAVIALKNQKQKQTTLPT